MPHLECGRRRSRMTPSTTAMTQPATAAQTPPMPAPTSQPGMPPTTIITAPDAQDQHRAGEVGLQHHQPRDDDQDDAVGQDAVAEGPHFLPLLRKCCRQSTTTTAELRHLRGLECEEVPDLDPAGGVVAGDADAPGHQHQNQQDDGHEQRRLGEGPEAVVVDLRRSKPWRSRPSDGPHALALDVEEGVLDLHAVVGGGEAGGEHHNEPDAEQQQHQQQKRQVDGTLGKLPALGFPLQPALLPLLPPLLGGKALFLGLPAAVLLCLAGADAPISSWLSLPSPQCMSLCRNAQNLPWMPKPCQSAADRRHGGEHAHDLPLAPAAQLQVVVQGRHLEKALAVGGLEVCSPG